MFQKWIKHHFVNIILFVGGKIKKNFAIEETKSIKISKGFLCRFNKFILFVLNVIHKFFVNNTKCSRLFKKSAQNVEKIAPYPFILPVFVL